MSNRDDAAFLEDMIGRIDLVLEFTSDGREAFMTSKMMLERIWEIVEKDIPILRPQLRAILESLQNQE